MAGQPDAHAPIFASVLGADWFELGAIVRRHYSLRPFRRDAVTVRGAMDEVWHSNLAKLPLPMARLAGALVPYRGRDVPIEVHYSAREADGTLHWDRVFHFPGRSPFHFRSHMELAGGNEVIEFVRLGIGMRLAVTAEAGALVFRGKGYVWRVLGRDWPLPLELVLGRAYVEERPAGEDRFSMRMNLVHPLFGELFRYSGRFAVEAPPR
ncbi:DUF4166 domain-containing protein [Aureimonas psammosilenae]|uniref:DUF4166 domain-containing protein n=1 Tax=Aureimonas psammosilenae TaxID=2495496 RepID=UPI0012612152|nr:DUF4166 domain-containing protein [Aureimonas psammosilenae]